MCQSLAFQIREVSRDLRQQEKHYFETIRAYEKNTKNTAIELSEEQKQMMMGMEEEMEDETNDLANNKVDELVKNINKLSSIYKELNNLVIEQGSLIDRIDVNIESTLEHTQKAVVRLVAAEEAASSPFADKVMKILAIMILMMAVILGLKWAA